MRHIATPLAAALILALAACQPAPGPQSSGPEAGAVAAGAISSSAELEGEYRLAGLNGEDPNLPEGVAVAISASEISLPGNCLNLKWSYRFEGQRLVTQRIEGASCRRAVLPHEQAITEIFTGADRVSRTPSNGILFEGAGGSLTLFSQ